MNDIGRDIENYLKKPYSRIVIPDEESGTYTAELLEFPGCIAQGDSAQQAYERLEEAARAWIEAALDLNQGIPPPALAQGYGGKVALRLPKSLHRQAAMAAERDGTSLNQFIVTATAEKVGAHRLYEKLIGRMEQCFVTKSNVTVGSTMQAAAELSFVGGSYFTVYHGVSSIMAQAANSMFPSFPISDLNISKKGVTANA